VPAGSRLHGTAAMSRFVVTGELGQCELKTSAGAMQLDKAGPLELKGDERHDHALFRYRRARIAEIIQRQAGA
jgi:hypothetical protein